MRQKAEQLFEERLDGETEQKDLQEEKQGILTITLQKLMQKNLVAVALKLSVLTSIGILGRAAFQWLPSVEPIVPLAVAIGFFFGYKYALPSGMGAFYLSNFVVWGGQGPWTLFQVAGTGLAALTGAALGKISQSKYSFFTAVLAGTVFYEIMVDLTWLLLFGWISWELAFVPALPFSVIHVASSMGFAMVVYAFKDKFSELNREDILYELKVIAGGHRDSGPGRDRKPTAGKHNWLRRIKRWKLRGHG